MQRVTIQEARKLFDRGVTIYLLPTRTSYVEGVDISVYTNNKKDLNFNKFVDNYKAVSSHKMRYYVKKEELHKAITNGKQVSKGLVQDVLTKLPRIGSNIASIWGGECYDYKINNKTQKVTFFCIEHGEEFTTEIEFNKLKDYM